MGSAGFSQSRPDKADHLDKPSLNLPPLQRDAGGNIDLDSIPDVIQWFLDYDERVDFESGKKRSAIRPLMIHQLVCQAVVRIQLQRLAVRDGRRHLQS